MSVLVTGLSGFVGSHCRERMAAKDLDLDGRPADLRDASAVRSAVAIARPDAVIHLAAQSSVPAAFADPSETLHVNLFGTLNLLMALRDAGFRGRMLYVGSGDVYGLVPEVELPVRETRPPLPRNPYAVSKVAAEALCYQWSQTADFQIVLARPFNHIGPGQGPQFAVSDFARQIVQMQRGERPAVLTVGDIDTTRDFTDVRDVVAAYQLLLERGGNGEIYNVCSGRETSLRQVITMLLRQAGVVAELRVDPSRLRVAEQRRVCGSNERLHRATGWQPSIDIERTLADTLLYWKNKDQVS